MTIILRNGDTITLTVSDIVFSKTEYKVYIGDIGRTIAIKDIERIQP